MNLTAERKFEWEVQVEIFCPDLTFMEHWWEISQRLRHRGSTCRATGSRTNPTACTNRARMGPDGRFVMPTQRLRKVANNSFILTFKVPPNAARKAYFIAICLDCLASGPPPSFGG